MMTTTNEITTVDGQKLTATISGEYAMALMPDAAPGTIVVLGRCAGIYDLIAIVGGPHAPQVARALLQGLVSGTIKEENTIEWKNALNANMQRRTA